MEATNLWGEWKTPENYISEILTHYSGWESYDLSASHRVEGFIYLAISKNRNYCKIGFSKNPEKRIKEQHKPKEIIKDGGLALEVCFKGTLADEFALHKKFRPFAVQIGKGKTQVKTEWYQVEADILNYFDSKISPDLVQAG